MDDPWRFVERVTVRNLHTGFIGEARTHANWAVGEIKDNPTEALESAAEALACQLALLAAKRPQPKPATHSDDWEDLL